MGPPQGPTAALVANLEIVNGEEGSNAPNVVHTGGDGFASAHGSDPTR
jgi:hypothetical protein